MTDRTLPIKETEMPHPETAAAACDFPGKPGPAGHVNACQLCPASPTYWRGEGVPEGAKPCRWTPSTPKEALRP